MKKILLTLIGSLIVAIPLCWAASDTDDFNRGNANPIDGSWTSVPGTSENRIISEAAHPTDTPGGGSVNTSVTTSFTASPNQFSQVDIAVYTGNTPVVGLVLRGDHGTGDLYACLARDGSETTLIALPSFSVFAQDFGVTWTAGDAVYCEVNGSDFTMKQNGNIALIGTDASFSTGQPGIWLSSDSSVNDAALDNWSGGDLTGAVTRPPRRAVQF